LYLNRIRFLPVQAGTNIPTNKLNTTESDMTKSVMLINACFIIQMFFFVYTRLLHFSVRKGKKYF